MNWSEIISKKKQRLKEDVPEIYECLIKVPDRWSEIEIEMDNNTVKDKIQP